MADRSKLAEAYDAGFQDAEEQHDGFPGVSGWVNNNPWRSGEIQMERLSRDEMLMEMAHVVARRGTCSRLQVGAVFSMDGRIVATGYNGAPAGLPHCQHTEGDSGCDYAEHSERNAIAFAARKGLALEGTELHVTHMPCLACARSVINSGVTRVVYAIPYRLQDGVELLRQVGIEVVAAPN